MNYKEKVIEVINGVAKKEYFSIEDVEIPANKEHGDFALPCFKLAKELKKSPIKIALDFVGEISKHGKKKIFDKVVAVGPYVNFFVPMQSMVEEVLTEAQKGDYGSKGIGKRKKILLEHTSSNPNAPLHLGRARNSLIGDSIKRILNFEQYDVKTHFFVNDVGKQIALLVMAVRAKELEKLDFNNILEAYIEINKQAEEDSQIEQGAFELLKSFEDGDKEVIKLFGDIVKVCVENQSKSLEEIGIKFDSFDYESKFLFNKKTDDVLNRLSKTKKLFKDREGRNVLNQDNEIELKNSMKSPVLVLTRKDGTSLYPLRDLVYTEEKMKSSDNNILILGEDQKLYFKQIVGALKLLGYGDKIPRVVNYSFVLLDEGKMATRKGNVVLLGEFREKLLEKAKEELRKRYHNMDKKRLDELGKMIGYGALKYAILKVSPDKNVNFNWEHALSFDGESAPYIQYTHARACSILRKGRLNIKIADFKLIQTSKEKGLVKKIGEFKDIAEKACEELRPHIVAVYLYELSKLFNEFYSECQVINENKIITNTRMMIVNGFRNTVRNGLGLLGIDAPDEM